MNWKRCKHGYFWAQWSIFVNHDGTATLSCADNAPLAHFHSFYEARKFVEFIERNNPYANVAVEL